MTFDELHDAVVRWAEDRRIIPNSTPPSQLLKTVSELGELADCALKADRVGVVDGIGDVLVTLIIFSRLQGVCMTACLESAYETIKDRRGWLTKDGVFVKEGDAE
jgi:NTP pyrophosphatase (non-canonical NTP hydrolase)